MVLRKIQSRSARTLSCEPTSIGEPQITTSGSPMSTPHQRVARHLAATSWLTRRLPMKNTSGSPVEPPVVKRDKPGDWRCFIASVLARMISLVKRGSSCSTSRLLIAAGRIPRSAISWL